MASPLYPSTLPPNTIRLLQILPGPADSPLECTLSTSAIDFPDPYHALSYVWGPPSPSSTLICNNHVIPITSNLSSALHEYRARNVSTPLWVDAICINQSNLPERTAQVRMMQRIYSLAACVVIWLGPSHPTDALAMETLRAIHRPWATFQGVPLFAWTEGENAATHDGRLAQFLPDACYVALATFLMRPWFTRIWIVQELLAAREMEVWCGNETLDAETVLDGASKVMLLHNVNTRTQLCVNEVFGVGGGVERLKMSCAGKLQALRYTKAGGWCSMTNLLLLTRWFEATDKRDKMFALVGLANDVDPSFVDYELPYEEVVANLSKKMLQGRVGANGGSVLDIWSSIEREGGKEIPEKSWMVDWTQLGNSLYTPLMVDYASESPIITRPTELEFSKDEHGKELLHVRGSLVDLIDQILPSPPCILHLVPWSELLKPSASSSLRDWHISAVAFASQLAGTAPVPSFIYAQSGETLYEAFWRTLCCNRQGVGTNVPPEDDVAYEAWQGLMEVQNELFTREKQLEDATRWQKGWFYTASTALVALITYPLRARPLLRWIAPLCLPPIVWFFRAVWSARLKLLVQQLRGQYTKEMIEYTMRQSSFEASFSQWCQGRQLCLTRKGYLGWVPVAARVGDAVGLFAGCRIPYVLGWYGGEEYRIVGDAYLHGVMDGQGEGLEGTMLKIG
ncbi:heterokaryon incompatibility protein-domain-containing protein [Phaeosphaeria sp. MPI-PUGE-AT-0046c]|nr:heterokaryon incompatibility protein-domain-containing protein [Phaeosphaeria sp. MPI-PUGE-AT-0046c]